MAKLQIGSEKVGIMARGYTYAKIEYVSVSIFRKIECMYDAFRSLYVKMNSPGPITNVTS